MNSIVVGIGEFASSNHEGEIIKTMALGSCVALVGFDPRLRVVGMVHVALPDSKVDPAKAKTRPGYFADTGLPALFRDMARFGVLPQNLTIKLIGGAAILDPNNLFNIGKKNLLAINKILWQMGMGAVAEDVGGNISRTVSVNVSTGRVVVSSPKLGSWML